MLFHKKIMKFEIMLFHKKIMKFEIIWNYAIS